ncbi:MAG: DUF5724 domain-containing protein, partial [Planctomycetaceae bacterium]|nr:DUF5724 domain-containing protein [Planctomycetaceae bacterium]
MTLKEKFEARLNELRNAIPTLKKENQEIAQSFYKTLRREQKYSFLSLNNSPLSRLLFSGKTQLNEIFSGDRAELIPFLFGNDNTERFEKLWNRLTMTIYQRGWNGRCFRTKKHTILYFANGMELIVNFFKSISIGFDLEKYLNTYIKSQHNIRFIQPDQDQFEEEMGIAITESILIQNMIALALDEHDEFVTNRIKEIIYGDNNTGFLTKEIIRGIFISRDADAHKWVGDLLLAAKLQEGLRQTIVEACKEGSIEGFCYIVKIALENNLERFTSVVRVIGTWMGLLTTRLNTKTIHKILEIIVGVATNKLNIDQLFDSDNPIENYVTLWGIGLREIDDTREPLLNLAKSKKKHKQIAALYFLQRTDDLQLMKDVVLEMLDENDLELWVQLIEIINSLLQNEQRIRTNNKLQNKINKTTENEDKDEIKSTDKKDDSNFEQIIDFNLSDLKLNFDNYFEQCRLSDAEIRKIFVRLNQLAESTPKKETQFEPDAFNENIRRISANDFILQMISCVTLLGCNDADVQILLSHVSKKMNTYVKSNLINSVLKMDNPKYRKILIDLFCDPFWGDYRVTIDNVFKDAILMPEEYETIENALRFKDAKIRLETINLILKQPPENLQKSIERLLNSKEEQKRLAGLDLIDQAEKLSKDKKEYAAVVSACKQTTTHLAGNEKKKGTKKSAAEEILVQKIMETKKIEYTKENGFGLCDPNGKTNIPDPQKPNKLLADIFIAEMPRLEQILLNLDNLMHQYRDYEFTGYYRYDKEEEGKITTFGSSQCILFINSLEEREKKYGKNETKNWEDYVLGDVWQNFYKEQKLTAQDIVLLCIFLLSVFNEEFDKICKGVGQYGKCTSEFKDWLNSVCWNDEKMKPYYEHIRTKYRYILLIGTLMDLFYEFTPDEAKLDFMLDILSGIYHATPKNLFTQVILKVSREYTIFDASIPPFAVPHHEVHRADLPVDSPQFEKRFNILYKFYETSNYTHAAQSIKEFENARELNLIDDDELLREILIRRSPYLFQSAVALTYSGWHFRHVMNQDIPSRHSHLKKLLPKVVDRILEIELLRGDTPTEVSNMAMMISYFEGIRYFVKILKAMDQTPFTRGYNCSDIYSRSDVFSSLLRACEPEKNADITLFAGIPEQRLLEAAMYAPQWIDLVQEFLGWEGLTSACWYFHAHINESMDETKESIIARYSPISPQHFRDGAFDIDWFNDAYKT